MLWLEFNWQNSSDPHNDLFRPVIQAIELVKDYVQSPRQFYPEDESIPIKEVVASKWREFVVEQNDDGSLVTQGN